MVAYEVGCWLIRLVFYEAGIGIGIGSLSDDLCWLMRLDLAYNIDHSLLAYEVGCWLIRLHDVCFE